MQNSRIFKVKNTGVSESKYPSKTIYYCEKQAFFGQLALNNIIRRMTPILAAFSR